MDPGVAISRNPDAWGVGVPLDFKETSKSRTDFQNTLFNKERWRSHYFTALANIVWSMFEWENLPHTINPFFIEKQLHTLGHVAFYDDPILGKMVVSGAFTNLNPYHEPLDFHAAMVGYNREFMLRTHLTPDADARELNMGVLVSNMQGATLGANVFASSQNAIDLFSHMLAENKITMLVAQNHLKMPFVIETDKDNELSARNLINKVQKNDAAIFINKAGLMDLNFKVHQTGSAHSIQALDKLNIARVEIINEFLTFFGINNFATQKKERVITNEVASNNEFITHSLNKFLFPRQHAADIVNRLWGTDIKVKLRDNIEVIIQAELGLAPDEKDGISNSEGREAE